MSLSQHNRFPMPIGATESNQREKLTSPYPAMLNLSHYSSSLRPGYNGFIPVENDLLAIILANIHSTIMQKVRYIYPLSEVPNLQVFTLKQKKICYQFINLSPTCSIFGHAINHMTIIKHSATRRPQDLLLGKKIIACKPHVSNRVTAWKLVWKQKKNRWKGEGEGRRWNIHLPTNPTILENAPWYFMVRFIWKLTAHQNRSITNRLPLDYQICKITLFSNRTCSWQLKKL